MAGDPIELNRGDVQRIWNFMERVEGVLGRTEKVLDDHEARLRTVETAITTAKSERAFTRWVLPVVLSVGALAVSFWTLIKRNGGP